MTTYLTTNTDGGARNRAHHLTLKAAHLAIAVVLLVVASILVQSSPALPPAAANEGGGPTAVWLVTLEDNDAGWWIIDGESQWLAPECRASIEADGGYFNVVPWSTIENTADATIGRDCDGIANLYFGYGHPEPEPQPQPEPPQEVAPDPSDPAGVWLVTLESNGAGWWIIDGESQWLAPQCRASIEADGGYFNVVPWSTIENTTDATIDRDCDEIANLYFGNDDSEPDPEPQPEPQPGSSDAIRLVTLESNGAGWWIIDGESQWLAPQCRASIEADGGYFNVVPWSTIENTTDATVDRDCDEIANLYFGNDGSEPDPDTEPQPTPDPEPEPQPEPEPEPEPEPDEPTSGAARLARGINLAGDFEVTPRGSWGTTIEDRFFPLVAQAGFDHVRIPIAWSAYTGPAPDYRIAESFFGEVDRLVELANGEDLGIVLDVHFFQELDENPLGERDRYLAIWDQIARRYQNEPGSVVFELLNEPVGVFNDQPEIWNQLAAEALAVVRQTNPNRAVIIGPVNYNHASRLPDLQLPNDPNLVATIHTYDPHAFTHQGAVFNDPTPPTGVLWRPNDATVGLDWLDQSWGVAVSAGSNGLQVDYLQQYGALAVLAEHGGQQYSELIIEADRAFDAVALCNIGPAAQAITITFVGGRGTADVSTCNNLTSIGVQLVGSSPGGVNIERLALCARTCDEIIVTQYQALDAMISTAAAWAENQGVPLYIGEFGTLDPIGDPTDPQSRADWTRAIRTIADENNVGWAYFELNSEFGAYDRASGQWIPEILGALID